MVSSVQPSRLAWKVISWTTPAHRKVIYFSTLAIDAVRLIGFSIIQRWHTARYWLWKTASPVEDICTLICTCTRKEWEPNSSKSPPTATKMATIVGSSRNSTKPLLNGTAPIPSNWCITEIWSDWSTDPLDVTFTATSIQHPFPGNIIKSPVMAT